MCVFGSPTVEKCEGVAFADIWLLSWSEIKYTFYRLFSFYSSLLNSFLHDLVRECWVHFVDIIFRKTFPNTQTTGQLRTFCRTQMSISYGIFYKLHLDYLKKGKRRHTLVATAKPPIWQCTYFLFGWRSKKSRNSFL